MMKKLNVVFLLATVALVGGGLRYVLRPGRHFDPSLWGNPATSASVRLWEIKLMSKQIKSKGRCQCCEARCSPFKRYAPGHPVTYSWLIGRGFEPTGRHPKGRKQKTKKLKEGQALSSAMEKV
jgi:hypothetical protein